MIGLKSAVKQLLLVCTTELYCVMVKNKKQQASCQMHSDYKVKKWEKKKVLFPAGQRSGHFMNEVLNVKTFPHNGHMVCGR